MSVCVFFAFSSGLASTMQVPTGTKARLLAHVERVESVLGIPREKYLDNPVHWDVRARGGFADVADEVLCRTVEEHNQWVRNTYRKFADWQKSPVVDGESLTPTDAAEFWHGFEELVVPPIRWTMEYYRARMDSVYETMRGRESEGVTFDAKDEAYTEICPVEFDRIVEVRSAAKGGSE